MYKSAITLAVVLLITITGNAQSWQWGRSGGSIFDGLNTLPYESVIDMTTDKAGNVYTLAWIEASNPVTFDGHVLTTYGQKDIYLFKYDCNGNYKWGKVIGGPEVDFPGSIGTDTLGHVYVSGSVIHASQPLYSGFVHFDTDSTAGLTNYKTLFLVQYDTAGTMKWLRQPNPDTASYASNSTISRRYAMEVAPNGDAYWLVVMNAGVVTGGGTPWLVPATSTWILKYDAQGVMTDHIPIQMELERAVIEQLSMTRSAAGRFIMAGDQQIIPGNPSRLRMGGQTLEHNMFVASFNPAGQLLWKKEDSAADYFGGRIFRKPLTDDLGNIYCSGVSFHGDSFNTYQFHNPLSPLHYDMPFVSKMDANGNHRWTRVAGAVSANINNGLTFKSSTEILLAGTSNSLYWDSAHQFSRMNAGYHFYITRFDTAGHLLSLDTLVGASGDRNLLAASATDHRGNLYVGGQIGGEFVIGGQLIQDMGGRTDVLMAKFGFANCNCTAAPVASFNSNTSNRTVTLSYTGAAAVDSVKWTFGNGASITRTGSAITTPFSYTYPAGQNGSYNICATAYNGCGNADICNGVMIGSASTGSLGGLEHIKIYPNPTNDKLKIDGLAQDATAMLLDLAGRQVMPTFRVQDRQEISISSLASGTYLLMLTTENGSRQAARVIRR